MAFQPAPPYEIYAVKFAQVNFGVSNLIAGADRTLAERNISEMYAARRSWIGGVAMSQTRRTRC